VYRNQSMVLTRQTPEAQRAAEGLACLASVAQLPDLRGVETETLVCSGRRCLPRTSANANTVLTIARTYDLHEERPALRSRAQDNGRIIRLAEENKALVRRFQGHPGYHEIPNALLVGCRKASYQFLVHCACRSGLCVGTRTSPETAALQAKAV
jgi:hypothetical protein